MCLPRICIFTETYYPVVGGGETQARLLAEGLVALGFSVIVVTRRSDSELRHVESYGRVTVYRLPPVGCGRWKKWGLAFTSIFWLTRLRQQYDLIFVSGFRVIGLPSLLVSRLFGKACILKADSPGELSGDFFSAGLRRLGLSTSSVVVRLLLSCRNHILRRARSFVAISSEVTAELIKHGVDPACIHSLPNSVDTNTFRPVTLRQKKELRIKLSLSPTVKVVIFTGRLVSYKGLPLLLRVWREIAAHSRSVHLLIVGTGGLDIHNCETELKAFVLENGLQESVRFTGAVQDVHEHLQASDIFVFPTEKEAFGISLIEAMACRLPVISTPVGGIRDILVHEQNGLLVEAGSFQQLHDAILRLLQDSSLSSSLGQAALQTVSQRYSARIVTQDYVELFTKES